MKCLVILIATAILCEVVNGSTLIRRRRGYYGPGNDFSAPSRGQYPLYDPDPRSYDSSFHGTPSQARYRPYGPYGIDRGDSFESSHEGTSNEEGDHPPWCPHSKSKPVRSKPEGLNRPFGTEHEDSAESSGESSEEETSAPRRPEYSSGKGGNRGWLPWMSSTIVIPLLTTAESSVGKNQRISNCIQSCPVTAEYNPVCGSNNVTYANPGRLECEMKCGVAVQLSRPTACSVREPIPTGRPILNREDIVACIRKCPTLSGKFSPVCGNNNVTYVNSERLACEKSCGIDVELSKLSPCKDPTSTTVATETVISEEDISACVRECPVTAEFNPVCGSNNLTYTSPGRLECAQICGVDVQLSMLRPCESPTVTTETVNSEEQISSCMRACPVTTEFNPVCGSNNLTYTNPGRLECAQSCGVAVQLSRKTSCNAPLTDEERNKNVNPNFQVTTSSTESSQLTTTYYTTTTSRPFVNGNSVTNGETIEVSTDIYNNGGNNAGENLNGENNGSNGNEENNTNVSNNGNNENNGNADNGGNKEVDGGSQGGGSHHGNGGNDYNGGGDGHHHGHHYENNCNGGNNSNKRIPSMKEVMACMQLCALTSEYNPVCGTDDITYMNPGRLLCAQFCGIDVALKKFAPCSSTATTNCETTCTNPPVTDNPGPVTPPVFTLQACMADCPASSNYQPVCGSNNITYINLEKLQCAKRCGIDVSLQRISSCSDSGTDPRPNPDVNHTIWTDENRDICIKQCDVDTKHEPICGSDNVTYRNTAHLICARQCGLDVRVKQLFPCSSTVSPTPSPSTDGLVTPSYNGLNFTIPTDVLDNIWSENSTKKDDEDFELDQRVKD